MIMLLLSAILPLRADFAAPDFAFPQTVVTDAEAVLKKSTAPTEGLTRLKAVLEIVTARQSIDEDSMFTAPKFVAAMAEKEKDMTVKGLMTLLEAKLTNDVYNSNRYKYDRVDIPDTPLPGDMSAWSGRQFKLRCRELTDLALKQLTPSFAKKTIDFAEVLNMDKNSEVFYPCLRDFAYSTAIGIDTERRDSLISAVAALTQPGTAEWAIWRIKQNPDLKELEALYNKYNKGNCGGYLLLNLIQNSGNILYNYNEEAVNGRIRLADMIRDYLNRETANATTEALNESLKALIKPFVSITYPQAVAPGEEFEVIVEHAYAKSYSVNLLRDRTPWVDLRRSSLVSVEKKSFKSAGDGFERDTLKFVISQPGNYVFRTTCDDVTSKNSYSNRLTVTPWMPVIIGHNGKNVAIVADFTDGSPVKGVMVNAKSDIGRTNADGIINFVARNSANYHARPLKLSSGTTSVYFGNDVSIYNYIESLRDDIVSAKVFVNRPVYHPGDSLGWSSVIVKKSFKHNTSRLYGEKEAMAVLMDANYQPVDTVKGKTDRFGRMSGTFAIPTDRLPGTYNVTIICEDNHVGSGSLTVSDFKLPVFEIEDLKIVRDGDAFTISGTARRYSGMPVPDAKVDISIEGARMFWRYEEETASVNLTATTDDDGKFTAQVKASELGDANYRCDVTVTTLSADIASASKLFRSGKPYYVTGYCDGNYDTDSDSPLPVKAYDSELQPVEIDALWEISADKKTVAQGKCRIDSLGLVFDRSGITPGKYELTILPADTTMFNKCDAGTVWFYSTKKNIVPAGLELAVPKDSYTNVEGKSLGINVGVPATTTIYAVSYDNKGYPVTKAFRLPAGFSEINVQLADTTRQHVTLTAVKNGKTYTREISVLRRIKPVQPMLKGESMRDNLVPGSPEHWKIRLTDPENRGLAGAMIATLYNKALNSFSELSWPRDLKGFLAAPTPEQRYTFLTPDYGRGNDFVSVNNRRPFGYPSIVVPEFKYISSYDNGRIYMRGNGIMNRAMMKSSAAADFATPEFEEEAVTLTESATAGSAESPAEEAEQKEKNEFQYRVAEVLQAMWMPDITINEDGSATLEFDVPDAIGAWTFQAAAWTEDCRAASMLATLVSSKPVMVQPTLPRFMRRGDKARVLATVMNRTDSVKDITTVVEIFDPADGKVLNSTSETNTVQAGGQAIVAIDMYAETGMSAIGYRVKSTSDGFSDGEQNAIPVLEANDLTIDSEVFYHTPENPEFSATIAPDNDIVALQYCQNPVWDVVKTLPGLYEDEPKTACSAAASAYAAFTAKGLYTKFPEIAEVLKIWKNQDGGKALESKLTANEDLKLALLSQTPFVGSANANTEQMQRLALTFDEKIINRTANTAVKVLSKLQNNDGGFSWGAWAEKSSVWMTESVLMSLGRLNATGFMPRDGRLDNLIRRALTYLDNHVDDNGYTYTRIYSMYPGMKPTTVRGTRAIDATVQNILKGWKKMSTSEKTVAALILEANGNKATAREIMKSISQFAVANAKAGISFPSVKSVDTYCNLLEAFAVVSPDTPMLDGMRQWLILKTQTTSDLDSWNPTALVSAILSTGTKWTRNDSRTANVTVDGKPLTISEVEAATGSFSMRLEPSASQRTVVFTRPADSNQPSYGSVTTIGKKPLDRIKPRGSRQLSIDKKLLVERDGKWVETDQLNLGERVRVSLLIKADETLEYVTINDMRPASLEPVDQMPERVFDGNLSAYRVNDNTRTQLFIDYLPKGTWYLTYDMTASFTGEFISGTATVQSQYAPELNARSGASRIAVQ